MYTKEQILRCASEDELFALFHTFEQYLREQMLDRTGSEGPVVLDSDFGVVITKLKANYYDKVWLEYCKECQKKTEHRFLDCEEHKEECDLAICCECGASA